jgi:hypothetical protein
VHDTADQASRAGNALSAAGVAVFARGVLYHYMLSYMHAVCSHENVSWSSSLLNDCCWLCLLMFVLVLLDVIALYASTLSADGSFCSTTNMVATR